MLSTKTIALFGGAAALSAGAALAAASPASAAVGPCTVNPATDFCVQQVSGGSPALALADDGSGFHRVVGSANLTTGASHYAWLPTSTPCTEGNFEKVAYWDPNNSAATSGLALTEVNGTQIYNHPANSNVNATPDTQRWCFDGNGWRNVANNKVIRVQSNNQPAELVTGPAAGPNETFTARPVH